jgi:hypothetical protein
VLDSQGHHHDLAQAANIVLHLLDTVHGHVRR